MARKKNNNRWFSPTDLLDLLDEYKTKTEELENKLYAISKISSEIKEFFTIK